MLISVPCRWVSDNEQIRLNPETALNGTTLALSVVLSLIKREIYDVFHIKCKIYSWCIEPPSKISDIHETNWFMYLLTLIKIRRMQSFYKTKSIYTTKIMIFCALIPVNWVGTVNCFVYSTDQT